jgi:hypothetical protein
MYLRNHSQRYDTDNPSLHHSDLCEVLNTLSWWRVDILSYMSRIQHIYLFADDFRSCLGLIRGCKSMGLVVAPILLS